MSLQDPDPSPVAPLLRLVNDMQVELEADRRSLALLAEDTRSVLADRGSDALAVVNLRQEILGEMDQRAEELDNRQRSASRLIDEVLSSSRVAVNRIGAESSDWWEPPWHAPASAVTPDNMVLTRLPVSAPDRTRPQLARVLTIVGALLIVCGLLIAIL